MRLAALGAAAVLALSLLATEAAAQGPYAYRQPRLVRFGIGGGVSVPTSDYKKAFDNGYNAQAFIQIQPPGLPLSFRVTGTFDRFDLKDVTFGPGVTADNGYSQVLGGLANVALRLPLGGPVTPYVIAGLGALNLKNYIETSTGDSEDSQTKFAINGGAGLALRLLGTDAYVEARIANVYTDQGFIDTKTIQFVPVTFGIIF